MRGQEQHDIVVGRDSIAKKRFRQSFDECFSHVKASILKVDKPSQIERRLENVT